MDLRGLEAVLAVYENGSFSAAATALFLSQPALTRRVAQLERELDTRLFVRTPHGVVVTDTGRALMEPARRAIREAQSIRGAIDLVRSGTRGRLSVVGMSNLSVGFGSLVADFHESMPEVEFRMASADTTAAAVGMVEAGLHDLAIVDLPLTSETLVAHPVVSQDFLIVLGPGGTETPPDSPIPTVTAAMIERRTMIHLPTQQFPQQRGMLLYEMLRLQPAAHMEVSTCSLLVPISQSGRTVAVVPRPVALVGRAEGLALAAPPKPIKRTLAFARHPGNASGAVRHFLKLAGAPAAAFA
ncbi:LysR family transcriptional regulator [Leifsonia sp. fls2-241-R2A-40a]|uniref:LysR family transcriptional regulator n=1 Tax=Leifsonia sp. fls2-241-R2A-40a TaxID=3040290 RepID=UPI00254F22C2|nr:LysR family transcriptional regulator [Leifsonia sp. fls2-241-R2A-40a]